MHPLICPVCGNDLAVTDGTLRCVRSHSFDIAREGYVNLLPSRSRKPKVLGDTARMLNARRAFLDRGHYAPLSGLINDRVDEHLAAGSGKAARIAEIGSGDGYYIGRAEQRFAPRGGSAVRCWGMDRSKEAARLAAKRYRGVTFFVADVWEKVLFRDGSIDVLLDIFAPRNADEFARVLAPSGLLLLAIPGVAHLAELRAGLRLLGIEPDKEEQVVQRLSATFLPTGRHTLEYEMHLEGPELRNLVEMTPNSWHISPERLESIGNMSMRVTASFVILEFRK